ncbi:hypothetical protein FACS1894214_3780 [Planctomycetales bacterium]|nr:hypothetical protein FACS1894214_3780 [Planctomycetales bacterium]
MFQKLLLTIILGIFVLGSTGCLIPLYSGDPQRRSQQLLYNSENLRLIHDEWERAWLLDQPNHMTPYRTHGGII